MLPWIDILALGIVLIFSVGGLFKGGIQVLGGIIGFLIALYLTNVMIQWLYSFLPFSLNQWLAITVFISILLLCMQISGWFIQLILIGYTIIRIVPFVKTLNTVFGGFLGCTLGLAFTLSIGLFIQTYLPDTIMFDVLQSSRLFPFSSSLIHLFIPFFS